MIDLENLTEEELQTLLDKKKTQRIELEKEEKKKPKKKKKKMKSVKKAMWFILIWALIIQLYVMFMIAQLGDTVSLAILAGTVFTEAFAAFLAYLSYKTKINLKNMEMNYIPNYDQERGLY